VSSIAQTSPMDLDRGVEVDIVVSFESCPVRYPSLEASDQGENERGGGWLGVGEVGRPLVEV
jgi:hypothetical protein